MNIDSISADDLARGCLVSKMDNSRPFIETYQTDRGPLVMAYLDTVPIPLDLLLVYMGLRMSPTRTKSELGTNYNSIHGFEMGKDKLVSIYKLWARADAMRADMRLAAQSLHAGRIIRDLVNELFLRLIAPSTDTDAKGAFRSMMIRLDEDYEQSLLA